MNLSKSCSCTARPADVPSPGGLAATLSGKRGRVACRGFTLLEVLLALMLTSLLLVALSMAIDFHLRVAAMGRVEVEEGQLARTLLHRIADDLRNAVASSSSQDEFPFGSGEASGGSADSVSENDSGGAESVLTEGAAGLYGGTDWLQVDVGRVPRLDQYTSAAEQSGDATAANVLSDVKTVTYYFMAPGEGGTVTTDEGVQDQSGLVRRELDRAATAWANEQGQLDQALLDAEPIAPEVVGIEFLYFDGSEWVDSWDSQEQGGLPVAVQIGLALAPGNRKNDDDLATWATSDFQQLVDEGVTPIYRLLVHLPNAEGSRSGGSSSGQATSGESGQSSGSGSSGSGGSGGGSGSGGSGGSGGGGSSGGSGGTGGTGGRGGSGGTGGTGGGGASR